jgi:hypothetical protein
MDCMTSRPIWDTLLAQLESECGAGTREWHHYLKTAAPSLRVKHGGRTIVYLLPAEDGFTASFALGAKALALARAKIAGTRRPFARVLFAFQWPDLLS